jgi:hypothetical protein
MRIDLKLAETMLKFITKVCNKHKGLNITKYSKLSGEVTYELEFYDAG